LTPNMSFLETLGDGSNSSRPPKLNSISDGSGFFNNVREKSYLTKFITDKSNQDEVLNGTVQFSTHPVYVPASANSTFRNAEVFWIVTKVLCSLDSPDFPRDHVPKLFNISEAPDHARSARMINELTSRYGIHVSSLVKLRDLLLSNALLLKPVFHKKVTDLISTAAMITRNTKATDIADFLFNGYVVYSTHYRHVCTVSQHESKLEVADCVIRARGHDSRRYRYQSVEYDIRLKVHMYSGDFHMSPSDSMLPMMNNNVRTLLVVPDIDKVLDPLTYDAYRFFIREARIAAQSGALSLYRVTNEYVRGSFDDSGLELFRQKDLETQSYMYLEQGTSYSTNLVFQKRYGISPSQNAVRDFYPYVIYQPLLTFINWLDTKARNSGNVPSGGEYFGALGADGPLGFANELLSLRRDPLYKKFIMFTDDVAPPHIKYTDLEKSDRLVFDNHMMLRRLTFAVYVHTHFLAHGRAPKDFSMMLRSDSNPGTARVNDIARAIDQAVLDDELWRTVSTLQRESRDETGTPHFESVLDLCFTSFCESLGSKGPTVRILQHSG
jgi:hypothetical protein